MVWAGALACKSPIMKWANELKESSKNFTRAECNLSQQCQVVSQNTHLGGEACTTRGPPSKDNSGFLGGAPSDTVLLMGVSRRFGSY